jgi:hypothetical protein
MTPEAIEVSTLPLRSPVVLTGGYGIQLGQGYRRYARMTRSMVSSA